mmetsp:Transcript_19067/g.64917  ORF Transcript_19067/g.64917 Transcript_19067/m.64917 type:complete len:207 (-) Transcript_19067:959-1579(-)
MEDAAVVKVEVDANASPSISYTDALRPFHTHMWVSDMSTPLTCTGESTRCAVDAERSCTISLSEDTWHTARPHRVLCCSTERKRTCTLSPESDARRRLLGPQHRCDTRPDTSTEANESQLSAGSSSSSPAPRARRTWRHIAIEPSLKPAASVSLFGLYVRLEMRFVPPLPALALSTKFSSLTRLNMRTDVSFSLVHAITCGVVQHA